MNLFHTSLDNISCVLVNHSLSMFVTQLFAGQLNFVCIYDRDQSVDWLRCYIFGLNSNMNCSILYLSHLF